MPRREQCGPFRLLERVGEGAAGEVWKGVHAPSSVEVAIKIFREAQTPSLIGLRNEVRATARLDHPGIVMLFAQGTWSQGGEGPEVPYLAMEYCPGGALSQQTRRVPWQVLRSRLAEILEALAHAHARGVVHRDLKPSNVLLAPDSEGILRAKLTDFGISRALAERSGEHDGRGERLSGTLPYMAPEQLAGHWRDEGPWTDLYALGVIAYESTSGHLPWKTVGREALLSSMVQAVPPLRARMPVPTGLQGWLDKLLVSNPYQRFPSAAAALAALRQLGEADVWGASQSRAPATPPERTGVPISPPSRALKLQGVGLSLYGLRPTRLVGRPELRTRVWSVLESALTGDGARALLIRGPMGVGTSKFASWIAEHAHSRFGAVRLRANNSPIGGPADGLSAMIRSALRARGLNAEERSTRVAQLLIEMPLDEDSGADSASLCALLSEFEKGSHSVVHAEEQRTTERFLCRVARRQPVLLTINNAQWSHNALALCRSLLELRGIPLLVVCVVDDDALQKNTEESEALEALAKHERCHSESLGPLSASEQRELLESTLGLAPSCLQRIVDTTQGNALFATSLLRYLVQSGRLIATAEGFALRDDEDTEIPNSLIEVWEAQLDALSEELAGASAESLKQSLEIAAVLGVTVHGAEWRAAAQSCGIEVPVGIAEGLAEINLVTLGEHGWRVRHASFRDHLLQRAKRGGRWRSHHAACAEALGARAREAGTESDPTLQGRIGQHLAMAERYEDACPALLIGAMRARDVSDWRESHRIFDVLNHAAERAGNRIAAAEARIERVPCDLGSGNLSQARALAVQGLDLASELGSRDLAARARMALASVAFEASGPTEAVPHLERALEDFGDAISPARVRALTRLGTILMWKRNIPKSEERFREAQELLGHLPLARLERAHTLRGLGHLAHCQGQDERATQQMETARACFAAEGDRFGTASCLNDLGDLHRHQGKLAESEQFYRKALALYRSLWAANASTVQCNLGFLLIERGRFPEAERLFGDLHQATLAAERQIDVLWILWGRLACAAAARRWDHWDTLQAAIEETTDGGLVDEDLASCSRLAAGHARRSGLYARARWAYRCALGHYERMDKPVEAAKVRELLADLAE